MGPLLAKRVHLVQFGPFHGEILAVPRGRGKRGAIMGQTLVTRRAVRLAVSCYSGYHALILAPAQ